MRKMSEKKKKDIIRVIMLVMAVLMVLSFVILPLASSNVGAEEVTAVVVSSFETGKLGAAIEEAKDGTDLNLITRLAVSGGALNAADFQAICGYPNLEYIELAGAQADKGVIPENALASRNQLLYISLPANTETIGARAFSGNRTLKKISIPASLRNIGDYAFEGCENVEVFNLPAELQTIGTGAFSDCKALSAFSLPEAVTEIPDYCFSKCCFTSLELGPQVEKIGNGAFSDCHDLADIYYYGNKAFSANESSFQNLRVTIHTYKGGEGFDSLASNFVSISYDLSEDSVYTPPKSAEPDKVYETTAAKAEEKNEPEEDKDEDKAEPEPEKEPEKTAAETAAETAAPASAPVSQGGFSTVSVIIICILCAALGVTVTLLVVKRK